MAQTGMEAAGSVGPALLSQVPAGRVDEQLVQLTDRPGSGLVLTGDAALEKARALLDAGYTQPLLVDRERYSGTKRRVSASTAFDQRWIGEQRRLGLWRVLPDAGYVAAGDRGGLLGVLRRTAELGDAVAVLALHLSWLHANKNLPILLDAISSAAVPVALVLEYGDDPLGVAYAHSGLLRLLRLPVPVMLLRCDVSAVGALCFGAVAAAVGVHSSLRHLYPAGGGGGSGPREQSVLFRPCLSYKRLSTLQSAVQEDPDGQWWNCPCEVCADNPITVLAERPDAEVAAACSRHSMDLLLRLRDHVLGDGPASERAQLSWIAQCKHAQAVGAQLAEEQGEALWKAPNAVQHWQQASTFQPPSGPSSTSSTSNRR